MSRHFERSFTTDQLTVAAGLMAPLDGGPMALAVVFRLDPTGGTQLICTARTAANALVWDLIYDTGTLFFSTTAGFRTMVGGLVASTWYLYVVEKTNGSAILRDHLCDMSTDIWIHANRGAALADGTGPVDSVRFSDGAGGNRLDAYLAVAALFPATFAGDAAVETLRPGLTPWSLASPAALWRFNDTPVNDLTGNGADQASISGTTVDLLVEPPNFSYVVTPPAPLDVNPQWCAGPPFIDWRAATPEIGWAAGPPFTSWLAAEPETEC